ncbi:MAG: hypothetical protein HYY25_07875 [Candidatus Wallbacteria bacterium]|nr:hypothetical protein [Candidatus Wallbacteria bacterium]
MEATTPVASRTTGVRALATAWILTLICPGLGQMRLGARSRGMATLVVVSIGLAWTAVAYVGPIYQYLVAKVSVMSQPPDAAQLMAYAADPQLWAQLHAVSTLPAWIFGLSFLYAFADSAYLAFRKVEGGR